MVIFFENKSNKDVEIITIDKNKDLQFKSDRLNIFGQGQHYSTFLYNEWKITNVIIEFKDSQIEYDSTILKEIEKHFKIQEKIGRS